MKTFKFFALCSLVIALLAAPFAVLASSTSSPLFGTNFDSSFIVDHAGWTPIAGTWNLVSENYYASSGPGPNQWARIRHNGLYTNMIYQAKMYRTGCNGCANTLAIRASGNYSTDGDWATGYFFQYTNSGYISVWKGVNGVYIPLAPWVYSNAVKRGANINKLKVVASGSAFLFFVNDILVAYGTDSSITTGGQVGISFYKIMPSSVDKGKLYVDWARLTLGAGAALPRNISAVKPWDAGSGGDRNVSPAP